MLRKLQIPLVLAVLASSSVGQTSDTSAIILAPKPAETSATPAAPPVERVVSPGIGAVLSASMPAYSPPAAAAPIGDLREKERPRNQIPRLPVEMMQKYVVHEDRVPVFQPLEFYTKEGLTALSFKEHPGRRIGNFFNLNAPAAHDAMVDELVFADRLESVDMAFAMAADGDRSEIEAMQQAIIDDGFSRESPVFK
jgi:hypothetical protein